MNYVSGKCFITSTLNPTRGQVYLSPKSFTINCSSNYNKNILDDIDRYIINDKAVVIFWKDGKKTKAKVDGNDTFDKEFGFALAVFKYVIIKNNISKNSYKRILECIKEDKLKIYLIEDFNRTTFRNMEKSRKYLKNLKEGNQCLTK